MQIGVPKEHDGGIATVTPDAPRTGIWHDGIASVEWGNSRRPDDIKSD